MAIRNRTLFSLTAAILLYIGLVALTVGFIAAKGIADLERSEAEEALVRLRAEIGEVLADLSSTARGLAGWGETLAFLQERHHTFVVDHLSASTLESQGLDLIAFLDREGGLVYAASRSSRQALSQDQTADIVNAFLRRGVRSETSGLLPVGDDFYLAVYLPVTPLHAPSQPQGALFLARRLDQTEQARISKKIQATLALAPLMEEPSESPFDVEVSTLGTTSIIGRSELTDIEGKRAASLTLTLPRAFFQRGRAILALSLVVLVLSGVAFSFVISWLMERTLFSRLRSLDEGVAAMERGSSPVAAPYDGDDDEISHLAHKMSALIDSERAKSRDLDESRTLFQGLFEKAAESIFLIDAEGPGVGTILAANPEAARSHGYTLEEMQKLNIFDIDAGGSEALVGEMMKRIRAGEWVRWEMEHHRKDGSVFPVEVSAGILDMRGKRVILGFDRDITERKRFEADLREARERAEEGSRLKTEFLSNVTHELRTPLNSILGYAELMSDGVDGAMNDRQLDSLNRIQRNARLLLHLIEDILDFARIESERLILEEQAFSLRETIGESVRILRVAAQRKAVELAWHVDPEIPDLLVGDEKRLVQIVVNLLDNAVKFTEAGTVSIHAHLEENGGGPEAAVRIEVNDTGIGISPVFLPHIFEAFVQGDGSTSRRYGGSGLGLAIVSRLVEKMGGTIGVESEEGKGTHFTIRLRFKTAGQA